MSDFSNYTFSEKRHVISKKIDELIELLHMYDQNNVGMTHPNDLLNIGKLRNIKEDYSDR